MIVVYRRWSQTWYSGFPLCQDSSFSHSYVCYIHRYIYYIYTIYSRTKSTDFSKNLLWNTLLQTMKKIIHLGQVLHAQEQHCQEENCDLLEQLLIQSGFIATFISFNLMCRWESLLWSCWGANAHSPLLTPVDLVTSGRRAKWEVEHNFVCNSSARFPEACQSNLNCYSFYWGFLYADTSMTLVLCQRICTSVSHTDVLEVEERHFWRFWPSFWLVLILYFRVATY